MTARDRVKTICRGVNGSALHPDLSIGEGVWSLWARFFDGMATTADADLCPRCGGWMVERRGKFGLFTGCSNYPTCRFTRSL